MFDSYFVMKILFEEKSFTDILTFSGRGCVILFTHQPFCSADRQLHMSATFTKNMNPDI